MDVDRLSVVIVVNRVAVGVDEQAAIVIHDGLNRPQQGKGEEEELKG